MFYFSVIIMCKCILYSIFIKLNSMYFWYYFLNKMVDVIINVVDEVLDIDSFCGKFVNFVIKF